MLQWKLGQPYALHKSDRRWHDEKSVDSFPLARHLLPTGRTRLDVAQLRGSKVVVKKAEWLLRH